MQQNSSVSRSIRRFSFSFDRTGNFFSSRRTTCRRQMETTNPKVDRKFPVSFSSSAAIETKRFRLTPFRQVRKVKQKKTFSTERLDRLTWFSAEQASIDQQQQRSRTNATSPQNSNNVRLRKTKIFLSSNVFSFDEQIGQIETKNSELLHKIDEQNHQIYFAQQEIHRLNNLCQNLQNE